MSVCWQLVCDDLKEKLWCGQNDYLYVGEPEIMRDLSAFMYRTRGHSLRVTTDLSLGGPEDDYLEVGSLYGDWEISAVCDDHEIYCGVYGGSRRQALCAAAEEFFPDVQYSDITDVIHNQYRFKYLTGVPECPARSMQ